MYKIRKSPIGRFEAYQLLHQESGACIEILNGLGSSINDLKVLDQSGKLTSVISGYRSDGEIRNGHHSKFAGSKLSPFPNRIFAGKYVFENQEYQLPINEIELNNNLHAILHSRYFDVVSSQASTGCANLILNHSYLGTDKGFPFPYDIEIRFTYSVKETIIETVLINTGDTNMPIGDGWHPYFRFSDISKLQLQLGTAERVSSLAGNVTGNVHGFEAGKLIGEDQLDDCFLVKENKRFEVNLMDQSTGINLTCWQESQKQQYQYLQIYTPPNRKEIAVEPVTCPPNAFNSGAGLIVLKPGESKNLKVGIAVKVLD